MDGHDTLFGEVGSDTFIFDTRALAANSDVIGDFLSGIDRIGLAHYFYGRGPTRSTPGGEKQI